MVDIWSLACIIVELITQTPPFCGENNEDQLATIVESMGALPKEWILESLNSIEDISSTTSSSTSHKNMTGRDPNLTVNLRQFALPYKNTSGKWRKQKSSHGFNMLLSSYFNHEVNSILSNVEQKKNDLLAVIVKCFSYIASERPTAKDLYDEFR